MAGPTPTQIDALRALGRAGGEGVLDRRCRLLAGGVSIGAFLPETWLRLLVQSLLEVSPAPGQRIRISSAGYEVLRSLPGVKHNPPQSGWTPGPTRAGSGDDIFESGSQD